jgi:hypothetical protein
MQVEEYSRPIENNESNNVICKTDRVDVAVTLNIYIRGVLNSILGRDIEGSSCDFLQSVQEHVRLVPKLHRILPDPL